MVCLGCGAASSRSSLQRRLSAANEGFLERVRKAGGETRPDGDFETNEDAGEFTVCACDVCGGTLKPDVVFFGDNVPKSRVSQCYEDVEQSDAVLVIGSTLEVWSALRFVDHAAKLDKPIAIVNLGETRFERGGGKDTPGKDTPVLKVNMRCDEALVTADSFLEI